MGYFSIITCGLSFKSLLLFLLGTYASLSISFATPIKTHFLSLEEGTAALVAKDELILRFTPLDFSMRMKKTETVTWYQWLDFIQKQALDWTPQEEEIMKQISSWFFEQLNNDHISFSNLPTIGLLKTTGEEECGTPYTRKNMIVLPQNTLLHRKMPQLRSLFAHEFTHILLRSSPSLKKSLYSLIGFELLDRPIETSKTTFESWRVTNPDGLYLDSIMNVNTSTNGGSYNLTITPILYSKNSIQQLDPNCQNNLQFQLMVVKNTNGSWIPVQNSQGSLMVLNPQQTNYLQQTGENTQYIIHPDEIIADNIALLYSNKFDPGNSAVKNQ